MPDPNTPIATPDPTASLLALACRMAQHLGYPVGVAREPNGYGGVVRIDLPTEGALADQPPTVRASWVVGADQLPAIAFLPDHDGPPDEASVFAASRLCGAYAALWPGEHDVPQILERVTASHRAFDPVEWVVDKGFIDERCAMAALALRLVGEPSSAWPKREWNEGGGLRDWLGDVARGLGLAAWPGLGAAARGAREAYAARAAVPREPAPELGGALAGVDVAGVRLYAMGADGVEPAVILIDAQESIDRGLDEAEAVFREGLRLVAVARAAQAGTT
jgi:hypothetical protein